MYKICANILNILRELAHICNARAKNEILMGMGGGLMGDLKDFEPFKIAQKSNVAKKMPFTDKYIKIVKYLFPTRQ